MDKWDSLVAQKVKSLPAMRETWVGKIPQEMTTHSRKSHQWRRGCKESDMTEQLHSRSERIVRHEPTLMKLAFQRRREKEQVNDSAICLLMKLFHYIYIDFVIHVLICPFIHLLNIFIPINIEFYLLKYLRYLYKYIICI